MRRTMLRGFAATLGGLGAVAVVNLIVQLDLERQSRAMWADYAASLEKVRQDAGGCWR